MPRDLEFPPPPALDSRNTTQHLDSAFRPLPRRSNWRFPSKDKWWSRKLVSGTASGCLPDGNSNFLQRRRRHRLRPIRHSPTLLAPSLSFLDYRVFDFGVRSAAANYSVRNASRGETKLARSAGINDAASAD